MKDHFDVVVVGAGPVGLLTAIELTLGGARVLVLERLAAPSLITKALAIGPLGIEALQRRGMSAAIANAEERAFAAMKPSSKQAEPTLSDQGPRYVGHFAGLTLIRADAQKDPERRARRVDQQAAEVMLADRALSLGIEVQCDCDVKGLVQQPDVVDVEWASLTGEGRIRCSYLVGCDGGRSSVRKLAGFAFPGTPPTMTMYQAIVEIDRPEKLLPLGFRHTSGGMFAFGFMRNRLIMMDFNGPPEDPQAPVTREEFEGVLRRVSREDVRVTSLESGSRWTDNTRLADTYRQGRVLLAGDAAHVHSPFGGQGMSLGLVDAANLGWKLAAVIRGEMPESLLDTYTAERRPVAEAVLANTRAQTAIMRPDPQSSAMRDVMTKLMEFDEVNRLIGEMMTGLAVRYDLGSACDDIGRLIGNRPVKHGENSLYDVMQEGMGVFLDASLGAGTSRLVAATTQRIPCVTIDSGPSMLIRPDACVAWCGEGQHIDGLEEALRRWFAPAPM